MTLEVRQGHMIASSCLTSYSFDPVPMPLIEYNILSDLSFIISLKLSSLIIPIQTSKIVVGSHAFMGKVLPFGVVLEQHGVVIFQFTSMAEFGNLGESIEEPCFCHNSLQCFDRI